MQTKKTQATVENGTKVTYYNLLLSKYQLPSLNK